MYLDLAESAKANGQALSQKISDLLIRELGSDFVADYQFLRLERRKLLQNRWIQDNSVADEGFRETDFDLLALKIRSHNENLLHREEVFLQLAKIFGNAGMPDKASVLLKSLHENSEISNGNQSGQALLLEGWIASLQKKWELSHQQFSKAYEFFAGKNDDQGMATALMHLGKLAMNQWDTTLCIEYLKDAEKHLPENPSMQISQKIQSNQAVIQLIRGDAETACKLLETILSDEAFEDAPEFYVSQLINLAKSKMELEDCEAARIALEKAEEVAKSYHIKNREGQTYLALGEVLVRLGLFREAEHQVTHGFSIMAKSGTLAGMGEAYRILGMLSRDQNILGRAGKYFETGIEISAGINHLLNLCETYFEYSILARYQDDPISQRQYLERSLYYAEEMRAVPRITRLRNQLEDLE